MLRSILSRSTQIAISAMGHMAEIHADPNCKLSLNEIAESRELQAPFLGKILVALSRSGLVEGWRGPGGGYRLGREPAQIQLKEIANVFEREETLYLCPYGKGYCETETKCPLHDQIECLNENMDEFLRTTTLVSFAESKRVDI